MADNIEIGNNDESSNHKHNKNMLPNSGVINNKLTQLDQTLKDLTLAIQKHHTILDQTLKSLNSAIQKHHTAFENFTSNVTSDALWE